MALSFTSKDGQKLDDDLNVILGALCRRKLETQ